MTRRGAWWAGPALGLGFLALLLWVNRGLLGAELFEATDFAANSLLIQKAKQLELLTGNYSRVGFHHPGPAILYVLAAGEYLFHDMLHWVRSPIAAQVVAVLVWSAAWATALFSVLAAIMGSNRAAARATALFLAITVIRNGQHLESLWMPNLYYMPFAVLLPSLARLATGHLDRLGLLALCAGFLMHGHASFLVLVPAAIAMALASYAVSIRLKGLTLANAWHEALRAHRAQLIAVVAIGAVFALPIVVQTLLHFPGPIGAYLAYGGESPRNAWGDTIAFVVRYWGNLAAFGLACLVLAVVSWRPALLRLATGREAAIAVIAGFAIASAMVLVYAKIGVDDLGHWYIGMFYISSAVIVESAAAALLLEALPFGAIVSSAAIGGALMVGLVRMAPSELIAVPRAPELARALTSFPRPIVVDLDNRIEGHDLWSTMLAGTAYLARHPGPRFCIRRNWHVSFTHELRCTAAEEETGHIVTAAFEGAIPFDPPAIVIERIALAPTPPPRAPWNAPLAVTASGAAPGLLGHGWSSPEAEFTWTEGASSTLTFSTPDAVGFTLELELMAFLPNAGARQAVTIGVNGKALETLELAPPGGWRRVMVRVPRPLVEGRPHVVVRLDIAKPLSPRAAGYSNDPRRLGVALRQVVIRPE